MLPEDATELRTIKKTELEFKAANSISGTNQKGNNPTDDGKK